MVSVRVAPERYSDSTDSGEDAVTYNLSLVALNQQADVNISDFKAALSVVIDNLKTDIQTGGSGSS